MLRSCGKVCCRLYGFHSGDGYACARIQCYGVCSGGHVALCWLLFQSIFHHQLGFHFSLPCISASSLSPSDEEEKKDILTFTFRQSRWKLLRQRPSFSSTHKHSAGKRHAGVSEFSTEWPCLDGFSRWGVSRGDWWGDKDVAASWKEDKALSICPEVGELQGQNWAIRSFQTTHFHAVFFVISSTGFYWASTLFCFESVACYFFQKRYYCACILSSLCYHVIFVTWCNFRFWTTSCPFEAMSILVHVLHFTAFMLPFRHHDKRWKTFKIDFHAMLILTW